MANLTDEQATAMLKELAEHFGEPVMQASRYCKAISDWMDCIIWSNTSSEYKPENWRGLGPLDWQHGKDYAGQLHYIRTDIQKSALLARLIYAGEKLRTNPCPTHKGHLNMREWIGDPGEPQCEHLCGGTGWLPEPNDPNAVGSLRLCNKPYPRDRTYDGNVTTFTEYCRKLPGHEGNCNAWSERA